MGYVVKKFFLFLILLAPLFYMLIRLFYGVNDPIKFIYTYTGFSTLSFLFLTLLTAPLKKFINFTKFRRILGLVTFFYAFLHFLTFAVLDSSLDVWYVLNETVEKPFIYLGMASFFILFLLAVTSTTKLFVKYKNLHKLVYVAIILGVIHEVMAQKVLTLLEYGFMTLVCYLVFARVFLKRSRF